MHLKKAYQKLGCAAYSHSNTGDIAVFCYYDNLPTVSAYPSKASKPPEGTVCGVLCPLPPKMSTREMHLQSLLVSEKPRIIKELLCTQIKNAWARISHTLVGKYKVIQLRRSSDSSVSIVPKHLMTCNWGSIPSRGK
jgi:hypothetical protein